MDGFGAQHWPPESILEMRCPFVLYSRLSLAYMSKCVLVSALPVRTCPEERESGSALSRAVEGPGPTTPQQPASI